MLWGGGLVWLEHPQASDLRLWTEQVKAGPHRPPAHLGASTVGRWKQGTAFPLRALAQWVPVEHRDPLPISDE